MENTDEKWRDVGVNKICGELHLQHRHVSGEDRPCNLDTGLEKVESESHSTSIAREEKPVRENGRRGSALWGKWMHRGDRGFVDLLHSSGPFSPSSNPHVKLHRLQDCGLADGTSCLFWGFFSSNGLKIWLSSMRDDNTYSTLYFF